MEIFYKKMFSRLTLINKTIFKKYKILKIIGKGSFGSVYKGKNIITNEPVAIKVEDISAPGNILQHEAYILFYLKNYGIPEFKSYGVYKRYRMLVQSLLGENTENIFSDNNDLYNEKIRKSVIKDVCMIAIQLIDRLEFIHSKYIIHRDLKPENIMLDLQTKSIVYLIDFGMAKKYRSGKTKKHVKFSIPYRLTGTARYCSINALKGTEQSRRDDLESAGYVLIYLAQNKNLPWAGLNIIDKVERYRAIYQIKKKIKPEDLCQLLPTQFYEYIKYVKGLNFEQDPDYNYLRGLFIDILKGYNTLNDLKFSWLNNKSLIYNEEQSPKYRRNNLFKKKGSPQQRILQNIQTSREKENKMVNLNQEKLINIIEENQEKRDRELMESSSKKNKDFNSKEDTPGFIKIGKKDLSDESGSKIAHINFEIILDESDLIKEKEEPEENKTNIENKKNENEKDENTNNNKNIFLFENESFNGSYKSNQLKKNDNNIIIINSIENKNLELNKNKNSPNSPIKNNIMNIKIENCKENEININKAKTKMNNLNKGKIINITKYNIQNNNSPNKNQIQIIKDNNMIEKKKTQIKKIKLDINNNNNNNNNNNFDNLYFNKSKSAMNSLDEKNDITINISKSRRNFNKYNIINKSKSNRNIINYNKINILKYNNSTGKIIKNKRINVIKSNQNIQNIKLINNKAAKQINTILRRTNYKKMFSPNSIKISKNQIKRIKPNKMVLTPDKLNKTIRIVNYKENNQEINKIFFSRSKSPDNSILRPNLFNSGQFNSKFNNNIINNISYYYNLKAEPNRTQSNTLENNKNKNLFMRLYNLKKGKKLENQRLKKIKININNKNLMSNLSGIDKINKKNSYNNIKKNLILPIFDYTNNFFEYNKIINNNYNNTVGNI